MQKEALRVERARIEEENLRQMELTEKIKEDKRRKWDADMTAKKRHLEEGKRKENERKKNELKNHDEWKKKAHYALRKLRKKYSRTTL